MKEGIKFIVSYSVLSVCLFIISKLFIKELTIEIFSYLLSYYLVTLSICIILFPILGWSMRKIKASVRLKLILSFLFCILTLNILPLIFDNRVLSLDVLKGNITLNTMIIHVIATMSFTICYLLYRKDQFWTNSD
jgi:hypothetical protein